MVSRPNTTLFTALVGCAIVMAVVFLLVTQAEAGFHRTDDRPRHPLPRYEVPETAERVAPAKRPGMVKRAPGVFEGEARAGCRLPACNPGRPDILQAGDAILGEYPRAVMLEQTYELATAQAVVEQVDEALRDEASHVCAGVVEYGTRTISRLLFTRSYQSVAEVCESGDSPCYSSAEQVAAPQDGLYTRVGLNFQITGPGHARGSGASDGESSFSTTIDVVAAAGSASTAQGTCATFSSRCPSGAACQGMQRTTVTATATNVRAVYHGQRLCPTSTGGQPNAPGAGSCDLAFAYVPFADDDASDDADVAGIADCTASVFCDLDGGYSCQSTPCTPPAALNSTLGALLDSLCGAERDPTTGLDVELNQRCVKAGCGACPASGKNTTSLHRTYLAGPTSAAYRLTTPSLLADVEVRVDVAAFGDLPAQSRVTTLTGVDLNDVTMNDEGDDMVRVTVAGLLKSSQNALPDLDGRVLATTDYSNSAGGLIRQSASLTENPWQLLANKGAGLTPTASNLGGQFAWAVLPGSGRFGNMPGAYGESQFIATSDEAHFGTASACFDGSPAGEYYDQCRLVPGCDTGSGGVRGVDPPLVMTMCRATHILNTITTELQAGVAPANLTYSPDLVLPMAYDLLKPDYWVYDNYLVYQLPDGEALYSVSTFERPANLYTAGSAAGAASFVAADTAVADYIVGAATDPHQRRFYSGVTALGLTLAVDVSEDLARYTGASSAAAILATGTGCLVGPIGGADNSSTVASAVGVATVQNLATSGAVSYLVQMTCKSVDETVAGQPTRITPPQGTVITVPHESVSQTGPFTFSVQSVLASTSPADVAAVVRCTFSAADTLDTALELASVTVSCGGSPGPDDYDGYYDDPTGANPPSVDYDGDGGDGDGDQSAGADDAWAFIVIFGIAAVVVCAVAAVGLAVCIKK